MTRNRVLALVAAVGLVVFALLGGEYGTFDWLTLRNRLAAERAVVEALRVEVDSLESAARAFEGSAALQERVAREDFGMIRNGEILYRLVPR